MSNPTTVTSDQIKHIAQLANIPITQDEEAEFAQTFTDTLKVVDELKTANVSGIEPTHQVTGLENITRQDSVDTDRMFTQKQALANAPHHHDGYFVVPRIIDQD